MNEIVTRLAKVNESRRARQQHPDEEYFDREYNASRQLAVYGTLAPGRVNHHHVAPLGGSWTTSGLYVEGDLLPQGWGAILGYPALRWVPGGKKVDVQLLTSDLLPGGWEPIDTFEGPDYTRILVPVYSEPDGKLIAVANLYESYPRS